MSKPTEEVYVVQVEIGHKADFRSEILPNGFTHDWTVFVRSVDGAKIENFIERIVFYLHPSFKDPKRVLTEPPYEISESGYAGFILKIEIYFKNKSVHGPRKIHFDYDLYLNGEEMPAINSCRMEKLKFRNPVEDFKQKLLAGGAVIVGGSAPHTSAPQSFTELFGPPIKTSTVDSPKKFKHKDKDKEKSNKERPSPPSSVPEKEMRPEQPPARSTSFVGKDISNSSSSKDSSSKDKEMGSQKESTSKDKDSEHRHNLSSQSSIKDRDGSVSNKSSSLSSLHKDTSKKSSSSHSSKSSSKDSSSKSSSRDKKDSSGDGHKNFHKHKEKDKCSREKDSTSSATVKQASEPSSQDESLAVKRKKGESSFSKHQKDTYHKSSSSSKGLSKEPKKSDHKHSSTTDKKSKREDVKPSVQKPSAESEHKQSTLSKVPKEKSSPSVSRREKNKVSGSKKRSKSSSESSVVSSESSLHFTDEEEHVKGIDVDHLINICGDSDDGKGNTRESSKESSNSSHRLTSPSASPPPRPASNSSLAKASPNRCTSAKQNKHQSPHVSKDTASASQKHKELGKKSAPVKECKKETSEVTKNKKSSPPPKRSPETAVTDPAPVKEKPQKTSAASKPVKRKRDSSEEEGEITDSSLSLSSDSEVEEEGNSKSPSIKPPEITSNSKREDGEKKEDMEEEHETAHSSEALHSEPVVNGKSPTQINGKVWLASDFADNGYTLGLLLKIQAKIDCLKEVDLLQEIVDLVSVAGHLKCEGGFYKFDLCNLDKELVDEVVNIMQKELGPRDLWCN